MTETFSDQKAAFNVKPKSAVVGFKQDVGYGSGKVEFNSAKVMYKDQKVIH